MNDLIASIAKHGYVLVFVFALAEAIGLPVPAALVLVAAGAASAAHLLRAPLVLISAIVAVLLGDSLLFFAGRYSGWALLGVLCRVSMNPETCILRSAESFYKRGKATLLFAKFLPGINTMATPLAGSMRMRFGQFLRFDTIGASLYLLAYFTLGWVGRDFLKAIARNFQRAEHAVAAVLLAGLVVYAIYRIWVFQKYRVYQVVPRVQVQELIRRLQSENSSDVLVVDVRSHGYYDAEAARIRGSIRIEPNNLEHEIQSLPKDKDIYLYCT
jgi:membrane protein DedA with SNARE-associated domain